MTDPAAHVEVPSDSVADQAWSMIAVEGGALAVVLSLAATSRIDRHEVKLDDHGRELHALDRRLTVVESGRWGGRALGRQSGAHSLVSLRSSRRSGAAHRPNACRRAAR